MLNEMISLFVGMLNYAITEVCGMSVSDFALYDYFVGVICVVVTALMLVGAFFSLGNCRCRYFRIYLEDD